jgi:hypothetical protein
MGKVTALRLFHALLSRIKKPFTAVPYQTPALPGFDRSTALSDLSYLLFCEQDIQLCMEKEAY